MSGSLSSVREVWAQRAGARSRTDVLYLVYVAVLSLLIVGLPALQWAGRALARPDVMPVLLLGSAPQLSTAIVLAGALTLVLLGAVRGPALLSPFFTGTLASSGIRRRTVLWRPLARALLVTALATAVPAGLVAATLLTAGHADVGELVVFLLAALGSGLLLGIAWLAGQMLRTAPRRTLALVLGAGATVAMLLPEGVGIGGAYPGRGGEAGIWAAVLLIAGCIAVGIAVPLLDRLRGSVLVEQASRWEAATTVAATMDMSGAAGALRPPPTAGRGLRAIGPGPLAVLYARRDAVAWLRSPERLAVGAVGAVLGAAAVGGAVLLTGPLAGAALLVGALALWGASGTLVDGLRHGVHTLGAPRLFGQAAGTQVLLHATAPLLLLVALAALAGSGVGILTGRFEPAGALLPAILAAMHVAGRAWDAAKGPMPLALSTPMPTPQGDMSVVLMLLWQSDAPLMVTLTAAALLLAVPLGPSWLLGIGAVLFTVTVLLARGRLRALRA
ncbi:hypothetical protein ACT3SP_06935 [Brachybacterium sp. AOP43-C2-M15]|uniref:hypothetical protein n=1 Tax=Brachybacterium sp. AOP43-C2-M15 TaxID=3457661 RepID=UPI0040345D78